MDSILLKQRARVTLPIPPKLSSIAFRHPGYDDPEDILFNLPCLDLPSSQQAPASAGVHHNTALFACQIVANNAFNGYLATDRDGKHAVSTTLDGILTDDDYWFIVPGLTDVYPVVPRFQEWQFPHAYMDELAEWDPMPDVAAAAAAAAHQQTMHADRPTTTTSAEPSPMLPPAMPTSARSSGAQAHNTNLILSRCILSSNPYGLQKAHIIPTAQSKWFQANSMKRYGNNQLFIHAEQNKVPMRHDLHKVWDDHIFALVPKRDPSADGQFTYVAHVLNIPKPAIAEFASEWHNMPVQEGALDHTGKAFLFAKFAQAIFMLIKPFIAFSAVPRRIATFQAYSTETKTTWASPSALNQQYSGGGSKSASASASVDSRKRSRSQRSSAPGAEDDDSADDLTRNVRPRLCSRASEEEEIRWYMLNVLEKACLEEENETEEEDDWYGINVGGDTSDDEDRGRPPVRRPRTARRRRCTRSDHTVDTLPSLTDTSAIADADLEERDHHSAFPDAAAGCVLPTASTEQSDVGTSSKDPAATTGACPFVKEAT